MKLIPVLSRWLVGGKRKIRLHLPLLHHLQRSTEDGTAQVGLLVAKTALEAVVPAAKPAGCWDHLSFILIVGNDLGHFDLDVLGIGRLATQARERVDSTVKLASLDEVSGRIGKEGKTTT